MRRVLGVFLACVAALGFGTATRADAATAHTPVIFVHGFGGSASNWNTALAVFRAGGYSSNELFTFQYNSAQSNRTSAASLGQFVTQVLQQTGASKVDIVNHSMGGLVSDWYLKELGGQPKIERLASIAGANHGTTSAGACIALPSCTEMFPGSAFLTQLNSGDETPGATGYRTWASPCDGVIIPFTSTQLDGAVNTTVACQTHIGFLTDTTVMAQVRDFLAAPTALS